MVKSEQEWVKGKEINNFINILLDLHTWPSKVVQGHCTPTSTIHVKYEPDRAKEKENMCWTSLSDVKCRLM